MSRLLGIICIVIYLAVTHATMSVAAIDKAKTPVKTSTSSQSAKKATTSSSSKTSSKPKTTTIKKTTTKKTSSTSYENRFSALVVDADTGRVLYEKNAGATRYPASLTKMMTLYLTFEALKKGKLKLDDTLLVSAKAAKQPQTNIALDSGDRLSVKTAIQSLVVRSANDSAMVMAESLGGTEWNFALMMTKKARELGMKSTVFRNPSGLPDDKQHTTAYDMARLAIALRRDFPDYYPVFKLKNFSYRGVTYTTHNHVLERYDGADGVKTGYIRASGFNVVTSARKYGYNVVAVVMGGTSASSRDEQMISLLNRTFEQLASSKNQGETANKPNSEISADEAPALVTAHMAP